MQGEDVLPMYAQSAEGGSQSLSSTVGKPQVVLVKKKSKGDYRFSFWYVIKLSEEAYQVSWLHASSCSSLSTLYFISIGKRYFVLFVLLILIKLTGVMEFLSQ